MKKPAFLILILPLYYIGVMYESPALLILSLTFLLLLGCMLVISIYLKKHISFSFPQQLALAEMGKDFTWTVKAENSGRLPVSRFQLCLSEEGGEGKRKKGKGKKRKTVVKKIYGSCGAGETFLTCEERGAMTEHCGIYRMDARWVRIYDYISLFSRKKKITAQMEVAVLPTRYPMRLEYLHTAETGDERADKKAPFPGNDYEEIRQIREYRDGDLIRHIHWKQTARSGNLWVKEYEEEEEGQIRLFLDRRGWEEKTAGQKDAFYILLSALLQGCLKEGRRVLVCWVSTEEGRLERREIKDEKSWAELMVKLYRSRDGEKPRDDRREKGAGDDIQSEGSRDGAWEIRQNRQEGWMRLTADLEWYEGRKRMYSFSEAELSREMRERIFHIGR